MACRILQDNTDKGKGNTFVFADRLIELTSQKALSDYKGKLRMVVMWTAQAERIQFHNQQFTMEHRR